MISPHRTSCFPPLLPPPPAFSFSPRRKIARSDSQNETRGMQSAGGIQGRSGGTPEPGGCGECPARLLPLPPPAEPRSRSGAPSQTSGSRWCLSFVIVFTARPMRCWRLRSLYRALQGCFFGFLSLSEFRGALYLPLDPNCGNLESANPDLSAVARG